ncbi:MAG: hypothetical protein DMG06_24640 [Acidobacteria bacterium]|nr:MAG: hypothetical protein DMG06_24640 [Acidobacteriota bacterium]
MKIATFFVLLLGVCIILNSCQRKVRVPNVINNLPDLQQGETFFETGDYLKAVQVYETYLQQDSSGRNHDRVLFRLALAYAFPSSPAYNPQKAIGLFERLLTDFPESPYKNQAELILGLQAQVDRLKLQSDQLNSEVDGMRSRVHAREQQVKDLQGSLEHLQSGTVQKEEQVKNLRLELTQLKSELLQREERLKNLKTELEELKRIDLGRRPSQPAR